MEANKSPEVTLADHSARIKSLEKRVAKCEEKDEVLNKLVVSVEKLATVQQGMIEEQKEQRKEINEIKQEPVNNAKFIRNEIIKVIISVVGGAIIGALISLVIKG